MSLLSQRTVLAPVVLLMWTLVSGGLQRFWPLSMSLGELGSVVATVGMAVGGGLWLWALVEVRRHGTSLDPLRPATALVTSGPFRFSRNPAYLGLMAAIVGVALSADLIWGVILVPVAVIALDRWTIPAEEAELALAFGEAYIEYQRTVRRWIGRTRGDSP